MATRLVGYEEYKGYLAALTKVLLDRFGDSLLAIVLYGSVARGAAAQTSDIDLLIVQREPSSSYFERLAPVLDAERALRESEAFLLLARQGLSPSVSPLLLSEEEGRENRYIFLDMLDEGIVLFEREGYFTSRMGALRRKLKELGGRRVILPDGSWYWDLKPDLVLGEIFEL